MEVSEKNRSTYKSLRCCLIKENEHFLRNPKVLPCSNLACAECIKKIFSDNEEIICSICCEMHKFSENELKTGPGLIDEVKMNELVEEIEVKVLKSRRELEGKLDKKTEIIERICEQISLEIATRIDLIKDHLDIKQKELNKSLEHIKSNVKATMISFNSEAEKSIVNAENFSQNLSSLLMDFEVNRELIEKNAYECQEYINDLNEMNQKFRNILRRVIFEPSDWMPDEKFIYPRIEKFKEINCSI